MNNASVTVAGHPFPDDAALADLLARHPEYVVQGGVVGKIRGGVFTPLSRPGDAGTFLGYYRVSRVIQHVGAAEVVEVGRPITTSLGATDIDIVLKGNRYLSIGGNKSGPVLEAELRKVLEYAHTSATSGTVLFYYDPTAVRPVAIATAKRVLGDANVIEIQ